MAAQPVHTLKERPQGGVGGVSAGIDRQPRTVVRHGPRLRRVDAFRWEIPVDYKPGMRVAGLVYADEALLPNIEED
jgi:hypothetical protein